GSDADAKCAAESARFESAGYGVTATEKESFPGRRGGILLDFLSIWLTGFVPWVYDTKLTARFELMRRPHEPPDAGTIGNHRPTYHLSAPRRLRRKRGGGGPAESRRAGEAGRS